MKKITVTITLNRTFEIHFDDKKLNTEWFEAWEEHINGEICSEPDEIPWNVDVAEADYPYINLAKSIAYSIAENDADHLEGLQFQNITENEFFTPEVDPEIPVHFKRIGYLYDEYDIDFDNSDV